MRQTLFEIPYEIAGVPLFGFGALLVLWILVNIVVLVVLKRQGAGSEIWSYLPASLMVAGVLIFLPKLFPGAMPVRGYGVMLLLAMLAGIGLATRRARQMGVDPEIIMSLAFWMFLAGIVGARAFHVIEYWDRDYRRETLGETLGAIANIPAGGLVVYGSLIGAAVAFVVFMRRRRLPVLAFADLVAPSLVLGLCLGRIGCLLNGCCYGGACELPWAVTFPPASPPYESQLERGQFLGIALGENSDSNLQDSEPIVQRVDPSMGLGRAGLQVGDRIVRVNGYPSESASVAERLLASAVRQHQDLAVQTADGRTIKLPAIELPARSFPVHPAQVYAAINGLVLCLFLLAYYPYRRRDGEVIALLLTLYPILRFLLEIIRTDETGVFGTGLSISQNVSLIVLVGMTALWWYVLRQPRTLALPAV